MGRADFERAFQVVFDRSANPLAMFDDERRVAAVNDALLARFGYGRDELLGTRMDDYIEDGEEGALSASWKRMLATGSDGGQFVYRDANGRRVEIHVHNEANVLPGRHLGVILLDPGPVTLDDGAEASGSLTAREREIVGCVAEGLTSEEIAAQLHISTETVRTHVRNAMGKLGARTRAHLIALALRHGHLRD